MPRTAALALLLCCVSLQLVIGCSGPAGSDVAPTGSVGLGPLVHEWPPQLGEPYPDLELWDHEGRRLRLSAFKGKVLLIEPIGMTCPACNAFAGGQSKGGFGNVTPQGGLDSIAEYLPQYGGGVTVDHPDLVLVHLLLYNMQMGAPGQEDAAAWRAHFGINAPNHHVVFGGERLVNQASYDMIPGFQLVDRDFILRSDSAGHGPQDNLWTDLLPLLGDLLREGNG